LELGNRLKSPANRPENVWFARLTGQTAKTTVPALLESGERSAKVLAGSPYNQEGCDKRLTEIKLRKGESVEKALRRLKKRIDREGTLREVRNHRHYEKPSERRRRKMKMARFSAMLSARYADL
jgi:small subunit ribosomal protein S21